MARTLQGNLFPTLIATIFERVFLAVRFYSLLCSKFCHSLPNFLYDKYGISFATVNKPYKLIELYKVNNFITNCILDNVIVCVCVCRKHVDSILLNLLHALISDDREPGKSTFCHTNGWRRMNKDQSIHAMHDVSAYNIYFWEMGRRVFICDDKMCGLCRRYIAAFTWICHHRDAHFCCFRMA